MQTFLFYDVEATGLGVFDQVIQFAAIRTDCQLQTLERISFDVRLAPDTVPSAEAMQIHHIGVDRLLAGHEQNEALMSIHAMFNQPGTQSGGYNTLGFDDEFLRFSFHQHLLTPYTHQYANGCGRFDLYPMVVFYYLYKPDVLAWPVVDDKVSFKLERLARHNGLMEGDAHDALVDVEATLALAQKLQQDEGMWRYLMGFFTKGVDQERIRELPTCDINEQSYPLGLMIHGRFGFQQSFQHAVLGLGRHKHYQNQTLWLRLDDPFWQDFDGSQAICDAAHLVVRKKDAEPGFLLPMKDRFLRLDQVRIQCMEHALVSLKAHPDWLLALGDAQRDERYETVPCDVEAALYQVDFPSNQAVALASRFLKAAPKEKMALVDEMSATHQALAMRYLWRYHWEEVKAHPLLNDFIAKRHPSSQMPIVDHRGKPRLSVADALHQAEVLLASNVSEDDQVRLKALVYYLHHLSTVHPQWEETASAVDAIS